MTMVPLLTQEAVKDFGRVPREIVHSSEEIGLKEYLKANRIDIRKKMIKKLKYNQNK